MKTSVPCPICTAQVSRRIPGIAAEFMKARCEFVPDTQFWSNFCDNCHHAFMTPLPTTAELARLYAGYRGDEYNRARLLIEPEYEPHIAFFEGGDYLAARKGFYDDMIQDYRGFTGVVVDFGGGDGVLAKHAFPGAEVIVVEEDFERRGGDLPRLLRRADMLFCAHVFEHLPQPRLTLKGMTAELKAGALVWIELPLEYKGRIDDAYRGLEAEYERTGALQLSSLSVMHEHIAHFSKSSVFELARQCEIAPLEFYRHSMNIFAMMGRKVEQVPSAKRDRSLLDILRRRPVSTADI